MRKREILSAFTFFITTIGLVTVDSVFGLVSYVSFLKMRLSLSSIDIQFWLALGLLTFVIFVVLWVSVFITCFPEKTSQDDSP